jgi:hypothetical protein
VKDFHALKRNKVLNQPYMAQESNVEADVIAVGSECLYFNVECRKSNIQPSVA